VACKGETLRGGVTTATAWQGIREIAMTVQRQRNRSASRQAAVLMSAAGADAALPERARDGVVVVVVVVETWYRHAFLGLADWSILPLFPLRRPA